MSDSSERSREVLIAVPDLGFEDQAVTVGVWMVNVGEQVHIGDRLVEISCPGVLIPITADASGTLIRVLKRHGEATEVGETLGIVASAEQ